MAFPALYFTDDLPQAAGLYVVMDEFGAITTEVVYDNFDGIYPDGLHLMDMLGEPVSLSAKQLAWGPEIRSNGYFSYAPGADVSQAMVFNAARAAGKFSKFGGEAMATIGMAVSTLWNNSTGKIIYPDVIEGPPARFIFNHGRDTHTIQFFEDTVVFDGPAYLEIKTTDDWQQVINFLLEENTNANLAK